VSCSNFVKDPTHFDQLAILCNDCTEDNILQAKADSLIANWLIESQEHFELESSDILKQYAIQHGKCYFTKIPMTFDDSFRSMSLALIDPDNKEKTGNLVLVCKAFAYGNEEFIDFLLDMINSHNQYIRLETKIVKEGGQLPFRKRTSDAGYDVHSVEEIVIQPGTSASVDTGIIVSPPDGAYYTIEGRSSVFVAGVTPYRGIIDGTYQGPLKIILMNNSITPYIVSRGDRIAQLVLHPIVNGDFIVVDAFTPVENGRMDSGWGSSGK
jgi:dUTP pyrophosphatase